MTTGLHRHCQMTITLSVLHDCSDELTLVTGISVSHSYLVQPIDKGSVIDL